MNTTSSFMSRRALFLALLLVLVTGRGMASPTVEEAEKMQIRQSVSELLGGREVSSVSPSPVPGLYEVMVGAELFYVTGDGKYLLAGKLYDIPQRLDLSSAKMDKVKAEMIEQLGEEKMVIFAPEKYDHTITVFTDIDCGYCRKLHSEIKNYNDLGIRVRYLMYPRSGIGSPSYQKAVNVFCADDPKAAMTQAKSGEAIEQRKCENPVAEEYNLGQALGIKGTPAIFLENGELIPGYVPADRLSAMNKESKAN